MESLWPGKSKGKRVTRMDYFQLSCSLWDVWERQLIKSDDTEKDLGEGWNGIRDAVGWPEQKGGDHVTNNKKGGLK